MVTDEEVVLQNISTWLDFIEKRWGDHRELDIKTLRVLVRILPIIIEMLNVPGRPRWDGPPERCEARQTREIHGNAREGQEANSNVGNS